MHGCFVMYVWTTITGNLNNDDFQAHSGVRSGFMDVLSQLTYGFMLICWCESH